MAFLAGKRLVGLTSILLIATQYGLSQNSQSTGSSSAPVFHSETRLVVVDVVATDKSGKLVTGLRPADFQVVENGSPQRLRAFEEHSLPKRTASAAPDFHLPEHEYTNFPTEQPTGVVNIVLFDMLNTPAADQVYARQQMLKFIEKYPEGNQVALFILGQRLQMVQGPTGDSGILTRAARRLLARNLNMAPSERERLAQDDFLEYYGQMSASEHGNPSSGVDPTTGAPQSASASEDLFRLAFDKIDSAVTDARVTFTLNALEALGRTMAGYPGRKNLIWLSGGFPFEIGPDVKALQPMRETRNYVRELDIAMSLLAASQIAIYPIDVRGVQPTQVFDPSTIDIVGDGGIITVNRQASMNAQDQRLWEVRTAMRDIARETGGRAFFDNDVAGDIQRTIDEGSHYYVLAYSPENRKWDGKYRTIDVKCTRPGVVLNYRRGYFATENKEPSGEEASRQLLAAMQLGMPPASTVLMRVKVLPPDHDHKTVRIDYAVAASDVGFDDAAEHKKNATLDFLAIAWDDKSRVADRASGTMQASLDPEAFAKAMHSGLPAHQDLTLKPGRYVLSLGVLDRATEKIGTVWVPLVITGAEEKGK